MAPSNRLAYIALLSIVLQASALPLTKETGALQDSNPAPRADIEERGCLDWLFCRKADDHASEHTYDVQLGSDVGHPLSPVSWAGSQDGTSQGGHYPPTPGMSTTFAQGHHRIQSDPGPSRPRPQTLSRGAANKGIAGAKGSRPTTKPGAVAKRPAKPSAKKPNRVPVKRPAGKAKVVSTPKGKVKKAPAKPTRPKSKVGGPKPKQGKRGAQKNAKVSAPRAALPIRRKGSKRA